MKKNKQQPMLPFSVNYIVLVLIIYNEIRTIAGIHTKRFKNDKKAKSNFKNENSAKEHTTGAHTNPSQRQTESTVPCNSCFRRAIQI